VVQFLAITQSGHLDAQLLLPINKLDTITPLENEFHRLRQAAPTGRLVPTGFTSMHSEHELQTQLPGPGPSDLVKGIETADSRSAQTSTEHLRRHPK